jgi:hypothetical protein
LTDLSEEDKAKYAQYQYVKYEKYPEGQCTDRPLLDSGAVGSGWEGLLWGHVHGNHDRRDLCSSSRILRSNVLLQL